VVGMSAVEGVFRGSGAPADCCVRTGSPDACGVKTMRQASPTSKRNHARYTTGSRQRFGRQWVFAVVGMLLVAFQPLAAADKQGYRLGERLPQKSGKSDAYKEIPWEALVPAGWNPARELEGLDLSKLTDSDPRAIRALEKLREAWNNAPVVPTLNGAPVRIAGFMVPLESRNRQIFEFLLVPYFGACIHTPPPPANQIIHVLPRKPLPAEDIMSAVWVSGTLATVRAETGLGSAGYTMKADVIEPYRRP
jgi:uncharacterized protein